MPAFVVKKIENLVRNIDNPKIALFGLAYKGNVDDIRESPSLHVYSLLQLKNYNILLHDPHVKHSPVPLLSQEEALQDADCLVILTAHDEFKKLDPEKVQNWMRNKIVLDTHNILQSDIWANKGFSIITLGKGK